MYLWFKWSVRYLLTVIIVSNASSVAGECLEASYLRPATLLESKEQQIRVSQLVDSWPSSERAISIRFSGLIGRNGRLRQLCCFDSEFKLHSPVIKNLAKRLGKLRFEPAKRDQHLSKVFVNFTLLVEKTDHGIESMLLLNQLISKDEFGVQYSAPQRIVTRSTWHGSNFFGRTSNGVVVLTVDRNGMPSKAHVTRFQKGSRASMIRWARYMNERCFIPGFVNTVAVDMPFIAHLPNLANDYSFYLNNVN